MAKRTACSIRDAQPDDGAQVAALPAQLGYPDNRTAGVRRRLELWAAEATSRALAAEQDGQALGIIAVTAIPYLEREGRWGRIVALVVSSACAKLHLRSCRAGQHGARDERRTPRRVHES